jgi:hypothetical protein
VLQSSDSGTRVVRLGYTARGLRSSYTVTTTSQTMPLIQETLGYRGAQVGQVVVTGTATTPFTQTFLYRPDGSLGSGILHFDRAANGAVGSSPIVFRWLARSCATTPPEGKSISEEELVALLQRRAQPLWGE